MSNWVFRIRSLLAVVLLSFLLLRDLTFNVLRRRDFCRAILYAFLLRLHLVIHIRSGCEHVTFVRLGKPTEMSLMKLFLLTFQTRYCIQLDVALHEHHDLAVNLYYFSIYCIIRTGGVLGAFFMGMLVKKFFFVLFIICWLAILVRLPFASFALICFHVYWMVYSRQSSPSASTI